MRFEHKYIAFTQIYRCWTGVVHAREFRLTNDPFVMQYKRIDLLLDQFYCYFPLLQMIKHNRLTHRSTLESGQTYILVLFRATVENDCSYSISCRSAIRIRAISLSRSGYITSPLLRAIIMCGVPRRIPSPCISTIQRTTRIESK